MRCAFQHFGGPLVQTFAHRLSRDQRGTVNFRRYPQQETFILASWRAGDWPDRPVAGIAKLLGNDYTTETE